MWHLNLVCPICFETRFVETDLPLETYRFEPKDDFGRVQSRCGGCIATLEALS